MPSLHDMMARRCAVPALMSQFGERSAEGFKTLGYRDPRLPENAEPYQWPFILLNREFQPVFDEQTREESIRETQVVEVPASYVTAKGITSLQPRARFVIDGEEWSLWEPSCKWGSSFVTFGMSREPLVRMNELRRAPV